MSLRCSTLRYVIKSYVLAFVPFFIEANVVGFVLFIETDATCLLKEKNIQVSEMHFLYFWTKRDKTCLNALNYLLIQ